jgi:hypothetical protein
MEDLLEPELIHLMYGDEQQFIVGRVAVCLAPEVLTGKKAIEGKIVGVVRGRVGSHASKAVVVGKGYSAPEGRTVVPVLEIIKRAAESKGRETGQSIRPVQSFSEERSVVSLFRECLEMCDH